MNPLKLKASATPITSANFQGLQTMSDTEIKNYIANKITVGFAEAVGNGSNTADINIDTANALSGTAIGSFVDTDRTEATGTHPATGATTSVTYYAKQVTATDTGTITNRAVGYDSAIKQLTDAQINTDILDKVITAMVTESDYTAGQYRLAGSAPTGGTWTARYTITDVANGGNTTYYIWQKTAATSTPNADLRPLKTYSGNNIKQMSDAEIQEMIPLFRNRIISTGVGTYKLQASTPVGGTWVQMGSGSDTREQVVSQNYTGSYGGTRSYSTTYGGTRTYSTSYTNTFAGTRTYASGTGQYAGSRTYSATYTSAFAGTRPYAGSRTYSGSYGNSFAGSRPYAGSRTYSGTYSSVFAGTRPYAGSRTYSANYASTIYYAGYVGGTNYFAGSRTYSANYVSASQNFTGFFSGTRTYSTNYNSSESFANSFAGTRTYSANYISPTQYFVSGYAGSRTYSANYAGSRTYSGSYGNSFAGSRTYSGSYAGTRTYTGSYSGTYAGNTVIATKDTVSTVSLWIRTA